MRHGERDRLRHEIESGRRGMNKKILFPFTIVLQYRHKFVMVL